ncbi:MAG: SGNH/GDSL hydrolase family protein [Verrucomicrobiota bacterium]|nr:SGNH/GDSL hydrolase family protein [Verrucomicrobiota bacterium]
MKNRTVCTLFLLALTTSLGAKDLPKALLIGDSISLGYTPHVVAVLKGKVEVRHHKGNAQHTGTGLKMLDRWVGETKWDVIHFNWGMWDLCYRHPQSKVQGRRDKERGTLTTSLEQYEKNLDQLAARLKKTKAKLIWAHSTTVPEGEAGRKVGDDDKYNQAAVRVMKKHGVEINDLNALTDSFPAELFVRPGDVHLKTEGSKKLGQAVALKIMKALSQ